MNRIDKKWMQYGIGGGILALLLFIGGKEYSMLGISNACAITGILLLNVALFLTAKNLGCYNLIILGSKKFIALWKNKGLSSAEDGVGQYHEFVINYGYKRVYKEPYIIASVLIVASIIASFGV